MTDVPKILIIGQPFNKISGGGITLSNLFKFWPKDRLFLATNTHRAVKNDFTFCPNVYLLGKQEVKIPLLLRPLLKNEESGPVNLFNGLNSTDLTTNPSVIPKSNIFYSFLTKILRLLDLNYLLFRINVSEKFKNWMAEIQPDIIYSQLGHLEFNYLILDIKSKFDLPLVIHIMDDWPEKSASGIFKSYWQNKLRNSFIKILDITDELITISDPMRSEYQKRYNKGRYFFHNPIKLLPDSNNESDNNIGREFSIGYFGRIGSSNIHSILKTIDAIAELNNSGLQVTFDIYTPDVFAIKKTLNRNINIMKPIPHEQIIKYMRKYKVLFLPLDFDQDSMKYAKYSFPTKASEYMVSGRLIVVFGPSGTTIVDHAKQYEWAVVVDKNDKHEIKRVLSDVFNNYSSNIYKITNAKKIARQEFDEEIVCKKFTDVLKALMQKTLSETN